MQRRNRFISALLLLCALCGSACNAGGGARSPGEARLPEDRDPRLLTARGMAYADAGDLVRAEQYFAAALTARGDERVVLPLLLKVCVASRHYRLASEYAEVALARRPKDTRLRFLAGALYVSIGEYARAREHLMRAAQELPQDPELQFSVGVFFRDELTDQVGADPYFREYLRLAPKGPHADEAKTSMMQKLPAMEQPPPLTMMEQPAPTPEPMP